MDLLYANLVELLIENYLDIADSLALFCISKKFAVYGESYRKILFDAHRGWDYCIQKGNLSACKLLYRTTKIDIHAGTERSFRWSCQRGHLAVAKWLFQLSVETNFPIDIHAFYEDAFIWSCMNGYLEVAKWIHQLGIQINSPIKPVVFDMWKNLLKN